MAVSQSPGIEQIFTSYGNSEGTADTDERVFRAIKEDLILWVNEWKSVKKFSDALDAWVKNYNEDFPHSSVGMILLTNMNNGLKPQQQLD